MASMPDIIVAPFKLAVVGLAYCVEPSAEVREEIQKAVRKALEDIPHVKVDAQFFQWHDTTIRIKPEATDGQ